MQTSVVVTSIAPPNEVMRELAAGAATSGFNFIVIGDLASPADFRLDHCRFYGVDEQAGLPLRLSSLLPFRHYSRKNIGYLTAMATGSRIIVDTDDDNHPRQRFWEPRRLSIEAPCIRGAGWVNVYRYFTDAMIWPRGLPLDELQTPSPRLAAAVGCEIACPIQQGLADGDPDVDAVFRLVFPVATEFERDVRVILGRNAWCPINSQNTTWFEQAFPLLYLPSYCSFRMTDIWRGFIAQRIAWENGWGIFFHGPTVWQDRNEHNLMRDFADEMPGYLQNRRIAQILEETPLRSGLNELPANLFRCYESLVRELIIDDTELSLVEAWNEDIGKVWRCPE